MVAVSFVPEDAAEQWRASVSDLMTVGMQAGRANRADFGTLAADDSTLMELDAAIENYKVETNKLLAMGQERSGRPQPMALLGGLQAADALLLASDESDFGGLWADADQSNLAAWNAMLDEYVRAMTGPTPPPGIIPEELDSKLDVLEKSGADELIALAQSKAVWGALAGFGSGIVTFGGTVAKQAFEAVSGALNLFRRRVLGLLQWLVERLRELMPDAFKDLVDQHLAWLKETVSEKMPSRIAEVLGQALGREDTEAAWRDAAADGRDLAEMKEQLDDTVAGHLLRIGYVGSGRKRVDSIAGMLTAWVSVTVPQVQIVVGAAALTIFAFVLYQVYDGFNDVERLASS